MASSTFAAAILLLPLLALGEQASMPNWDVAATLRDGTQSVRANALHFENVCKCQCNTEAVLDSSKNT